MEENLNTDKKSKLNKTWILVLGLVILTGILLFVSLTSKSFSPLKSTPKNASIEIASTSLIISENIRQTSDGKYETDILIDTSDDEISGAQIELAFNIKALTNIDIFPGSFINNPAILIKTIDTKTGVVRYAIAIKPGEKMVKGQGVIAKISFNKIGNEPTYLNFLPQSQVSTTSHGQSLLRETVSAVIDVTPLTGSETQITPQSSN